MPEIEDIVASLTSLIRSSTGRERECRKYLKHAREALVEKIVTEFVYVEEERRGSLGDTDYVISCRVRDETGTEFVKAYIWELKAPKYYIFERDTENRLRPTKELVQAENQLLNYVHENRGSDEFKATFGVLHPCEICFGGIIIGRNDTKVKGEYETEKKNLLFVNALRIRSTYFYRPLGIRILTWNFILDYINPSRPPARSHVDLGELQAQPLDPGRIVFSSSTSSEIGAMPNEEHRESE